MPAYDLSRRPAADGTAVLVATVVSSGIIAEMPTKDGALALLGNTLPTGRSFRLVAVNRASARRRERRALEYQS